MSDTPVYAVGDEVKATAFIQRVDKRACLRPNGPTAKVIRIFTLKDGTQIIDVQSGDDHPIGDLVVTKHLPLVKIT